MKNIPIPSKNDYLKRMIEQLEKFIRRCRWKAYFFEKNMEKDVDEGKSKNFGFKSNKAPPQNADLHAFEDDLYAMVRNIDFRRPPNEFQSKLDDDVKQINSSSNVLVFADKTTNLYSVSKETYQKLLNENITKNYKKTDESVKSDINKEAKCIAQKLKLDDRMEAYADRKAFITLKDHKENFRNSLKCRLLNPAKSEVGIVSKNRLEEINAKIRDSTKVNQWRSTSSVITWFKNIDSKSKSKFIKFDIVDFYPSISEELLLKALDFAKQYTDITDNEIEIIMHARKSLLFSDDGIWIKKGDELFDVTMGSFDGAEICELVGLFLLFELMKQFGKDCVGLYRDDGLAVFQNMSGPEADRTRKRIIQVFRDNGLQITIETNLKCTDFLDVTFDLATGKYYPFRKPNDTPLYIHAQSNHPPNIIKQLPVMISRRISDISCNEEEFDKAKRTYEDALKSSGHNPEMVFQQPVKKSNNRKRNILWFNPPYSMNVKTNIGKVFMRLVEKNFPVHHKFRKLFNKNNVKLSYCCMPSMASIVHKHNSKVLNDQEKQCDKQCSCPKAGKDKCPLDGKCLTASIVYKATVDVEGQKKYYYGLTEGPFKTRYANHMFSFRHGMQHNRIYPSSYGP